MKTIEQLLETSARYDTQKADITAHAKVLTISDLDARLITPSSGTLFGSVALPPLALTAHAMTQLCDKVGPVPAGYMLHPDTPPHLVAENLNYWMGVYDGGEWLVRAYGDTCRAVLSEKYSPIGNTEILEIIARAIGRFDYAILRPELSPDHVRVRVRFPDRDEGNFGFGVAVTNGETGLHAVCVYPFIQRHSCENSIVFSPENGYRQPHVSIPRGLLRANVEDAILRGLRYSLDMREKIAEANVEVIPSFADRMARLLKGAGYGKDTLNVALVGTEAMQTRMGVVNGLTFAAHHAGLDGERAFRLERIAGEVLENAGQEYLYRGNLS